MKIRLPNSGVTFDASEKTVTHASFSDITLAGIQLIVNVTDQIIIYNFADTAKGGTLSTDTLTLEYDTTSMSDTDELMVLVEDGINTIAVTQSGTWDEVGINDSGNSITVDNAGLTELAAAINASSQMDVNIAASNATVTVGGTVDLGATDNAVLDAIAASVAAIDTDATTIIGHVDGIETLLGTIDADTSGIITSVQSLDNAVYVDDADFTDGTSEGYGVMAVAEGTPTTVTDGDMGMLSMSTSRHLKVVATASDALLTTIDADTGGILTAVQLIDNAVSGAGFNITQFNGAAVPIGAGTEAAAVRVTIATDSTGVLSVDDNGGALTVDNGGTFAVQVDGAALTALQLIDNSIYVDDADWTADTSSHTLVGAVTQATPTANTDGDTTPLITNALRELRTAIPESDLATAATTHVKKYYTNAGAVTDGIIWSPAGGKRWYITSIFIQVSAAATVTLEDDLAGGDSAIWKAELTANQGWSSSFPTPWFSGEDAADLIITTTAGNVYVTVVGYEI